MKRASSEVDEATTLSPAKKARHPRIPHTTIPSHAPTVFDPLTQQQAIRDFLDEHGYVAVKAINTDEAAVYTQRVWSWIKTINPAISETDPSTWAKETSWPNQRDGVFQSYGIGQSELMWRIRCEPGVLAAFQAVWQTKDLLCSFDGMGMFPAAPNSPFVRDEVILWPHRDEGLHVKERRSVQGLVSLVDNRSASDGGFVVYPGTHLIDFSVDYPDGIGKDTYKIPGDDPRMYHGRCPEGILVRVPAGTLIIWDSRTIHCNIPPSSKSVHHRIALYVTMGRSTSLPPKTRAKVLARRRNYYLNHSTTGKDIDGTKNSDSVIFRTKSTLDPRPVVAELKERGPTRIPEIQEKMNELIGF